MKIWIDILTPKQLLFSESIMEKLGKKHDLLCTSRDYGEVSKLAKIRHFPLVSIGRHGGGTNIGKLEASIARMEKLTQKIKSFSPNVAISFCSPEAARVAFGLKIKHIVFCDSPHADAQTRLSVPLIQKLLIPSVIPKKECAKFGIANKDIIQYKAIDASVTIKRKVYKSKAMPFANNKKKNILIRVEEEQASYTSRSNKTVPIIKKIISEFGKENILILGRYTEQIKNLQKEVGRGAKILQMSFDGKYLLQNTDVFIGSGGTMTAESALMGVPTISYSAIPSIVEDHLTKSRLITRESDPSKIVSHIKKMLTDSSKEYQARAKRALANMEDPIEILAKLINQ